MEAKTAWEKSSERIQGISGEGGAGLGIQGQGSLEDRGQAWEWRDLEQARKGPGPRKRWKPASCEGVPTGSGRIQRVGGLRMRRGGLLGSRHPDPDREGRAGGRTGPGLPGRGPGTGLGVKGPANPGGGDLSDAGGQEGKGLKNTPEKGGAPGRQRRGLPGGRRPERKRSAEGQERGPERGAPLGSG